MIMKRYLFLILFECTFFSLISSVSSKPYDPPRKLLKANNISQFFIIAAFLQKPSFKGCNSNKKHYYPKNTETAKYNKKKNILISKKVHVFKRGNR